MYNEFWKYSSNIPFEELIRNTQVLWNDIQSRLVTSFNQLNNPNFNHIALRELCSILGISSNIYIITTNWDNLLEISMDLPPKNKWIIDGITYHYKKRLLNKHQLHFLKLHGSSDANTIGAFFNDLAQGFNQKTKNILTKALCAETVLFIGYSASDIDVRPILWSQKKINKWFWIEKNNFLNGSPKTISFEAKKELIKRKKIAQVLCDICSPTELVLIQLAESFGGNRIRINQNKRMQISIILPKINDDRLIVSFIGNTSHWLQHGSFKPEAQQLWVKEFSCEERDIPIEQRLTALTDSNKYEEAFYKAIRGYNKAMIPYESYVYKSWIPFIGLIFRKQKLPFYRKCAILWVSVLKIISFLNMKDIPDYEAREIFNKRNRWIGITHPDDERHLSLALCTLIRISVTIKLLREWHIKQVVPNYCYIKLLRRFKKILLSVIQTFQKLGDFTYIYNSKVTLLILQNEMERISEHDLIEEYELIIHMFLTTEKFNSAVETYRRYSEIYKNKDHEKYLSLLKKALEISEGKIDDLTIGKLNSEISRYKNKHRLS